MFKVISINKKIIFILLGCILAVVSTCVFFVTKASSPNWKAIVVIDAGHGKIDDGSIGFSGTKESELNLSYALTLKKYCEDFGYKVVLTRKGENGLYSPLASNKKKDDMQKRKQIIESTNPDIVISIHMNSFSEEYVRGAQVFYNNQNENSQKLANCIQKYFVQNLVKSRKTSAQGDYYIINCTPYTSVICECGYISNKEEESLLLNNEYKNQVCYSILCGILSYFMS